MTSLRGLNKPILVTPEFAQFCGKSYGATLARTKILCLILKYITDNNLKIENRRFTVNQNLAKILRLPIDSQLPFLELPKHIQNCIMWEFINGKLRSRLN